MKIKFTTSVAGARFAYDNEEVADLDDATARGFIKAGQAVPHREPELERAVAGPVERAVKRTARAARRTLGL